MSAKNARRDRAPDFRSGWVPCGAALLLFLQALLIGVSIPRNAPTVDEPYHLAVGLRYWDTGEFWAYHQNPPLTRLVAALPLIVLDVPRVHGDYDFKLHQRDADELIAEDFSRLHRRDYMQWLIVARSAGVLFAGIAGWVVFVWSRALFGAAGGLAALSLWAFCPLVLAHAGLVTPDIGATALMVAATYAFWRYLRSPARSTVIGSGILLGLVEGAKFSAVVLPPVWLVLAAVRFARRDDAWEQRPSVRTLLAHGILLCAASLATLNTLYLWEGTGRPLGDFPLRSRSLTRDDDHPRDGAPRERVNRFRGSLLGGVPAPFPEHYLLGFDDQLWDLEERPFYKYLRGELRDPDERGWQCYYLYGLLVKTPVSALVVVGLSLVMLFWRRFRTTPVSELALLLPTIAVIASLSLKTGLNSHVRYVLPAVPFLCVCAARVVHFCPRLKDWRAITISLLVLSTAVSTVRIHPHYLAYFNEAAGGPRSGLRHLADSNLDWGQGLFALREWLDENQPKETVHLACFGAINPEHLGIEYVALDPDDPQPGLHIISATPLAGLPVSVHTPKNCNTFWRPNAFSQYRRLSPIATPGYSIYIYQISLEDADRLRHLETVEE